MRALKTDRALNKTAQKNRFRLNSMTWGKQKGLANMLNNSVSASPFLMLR